MNVSCSVDMEDTRKCDEMQEDEMQEVKQVKSCSSKKRKSRGKVWEMQDHRNSQQVVFICRTAFTIQNDEFVKYRRVLLEWLTLIGQKMQWIEKQVLL